MKEKMFTVREVAAEYGRNAETIRRWVWSGKLPAKKVGNQLFISKKALSNLNERKRGNRDFLEQARALQEKIRSRTQTDFDVSLLIEKTRTRSLSEESLANEGLH